VKGSMEDKKTRPSFTEICLNIAEQISARSTCARLHVGCVITSTDFRKVLSWGYNGNAAGGPNDCDRHGAEAVGSCGCIHAEQNAVINCDAPRESGKLVFCTHLPCATCAKFLINLGGVQSVYYSTDYRNREGLVWLYQAGIASRYSPLPGSSS
jgi:dCMP deaminase